MFFSFFLKFFNLSLPYYIIFHNMKRLTDQELLDILNDLAIRILKIKILRGMALINVVYSQLKILRGMVLINVVYSQLKILPRYGLD
jgi:hypothetical protein